MFTYLAGQVNEEEGQCSRLDYPSAGDAQRRRGTRQTPG